jgi:CRISPR/Cas system CSM-associated protein Csm3 (group 7 of RAMP superfamily)
MNNPLRFLARVTIEFTTPFIIGGEDDLFADDKFMADANGLPMLPGSSIAGVLRHEFEALYKGAGDRLFGWQRNNDGAGSRLSVSSGCIHKSDNIPVEGRLSEKEMNDALLLQALTAIPRDHVCITPRGTAKDQGKFDEKCVTAGHRFTFELMLEGNNSDKDEWEKLLNLLALPTFRLGGKSRRGFGAFKVDSVLEKKEDYAGFAAWPVSLAVKPRDVSSRKLIPPGSYLKAVITLQPEGFWMIGGGGASADADMNPVMETRVVWDNDQGKVGAPSLYIPGSSIKGVLAHRTAFYANVLRGIFSDKPYPNDITEDPVKELFGSAKNSAGGKEEGVRGRILINDCYLPDGLSRKVVHHVSIDRFTGGARRGFLFSEKPVFRGNDIILELVVTEPKKIGDNARKALKRALNDFMTGRLAMGAGAGRGNGFFIGKVKWSDEGTWIGGGK